MTAKINAGVVTPKGVAMPEWLTREDAPQGPWTVREGNATRGEAFTNRMERLMTVPYGEDELSRAVRAHEMMHAKVSPESMASFDGFPLSPEAIRASEEFRVNTLCSLAGFDMDALRDGSETTTGKRLAENKDWNNTVLFITACAGTKACKDVIRGMRTVSPEMADKAKRVEKALVDSWKAEIKRFGPVRNQHAVNHARRELASTTPVVYKDDGTPSRPLREDTVLAEGERVLPEGARFTLKFASLVESLLKYDDSVDGHEGDGGEPTDEELDAVTKTAGGKTWARLIVDRSVPLTRRVKGNLGRRRVATNIGVSPRRMERLLTDPDKRVFDRTIKGQGGVVLIDQSGSMRLSDDDVMALVNEAPGCVVVGYSHRPNSTGIPNVWILADRGKVCSKVRSGNGGNGVDYPALVFANKLRKKGEPLVWVCDGHVTVSDDGFAPVPLRKQVAGFVRKNQVHMVPTVGDAVTALRRAKSGARLTTKIVGSELSEV